MRVFCAGFNLYGQFLNINDKCVETFKTTSYMNATDLQISHAYLIVKIEEIDQNNSSQRSKIYLHGFLRNRIRQSEKLNFNTNIVQISVCDSRALFLAEENNIFSFLYNVNSDCDLLLLSNIAVTDQEENEDCFIMKIASGTCMSNAYSNRGNVYNIPSKVCCKVLNMKDICTGREHCLILTDDGSVYSFGGGSRGQLGHGDVERRDTPEKISGLKDVKMVKIACGAWHSAALSVDGVLYTWGWNSNGQLGVHRNANKSFEHISVMVYPQVVEFDEKISDVSCGSRHTVVLSDLSKKSGAWSGVIGSQQSSSYLFEMSDSSDEPMNSTPLDLRLAATETYER